MWLPQGLLPRSENGSGMPYLSLHFEGCSFPWASAWYSSITHLHLDNITSFLQPTMEELLAVLVGSPALETLSLIHCSPTTSDGFPIDLPHLSALPIRSGFESPCARVLEYLTIPPCATLDISYSLHSFLGTEVSIASRISNFCSAFPTTYDTVRVIHKDGFIYSLLDSLRPWWSRRFQIQSKSSDPYNALVAAARALISQPHFSNVSTLHLNGALAAVMWSILGQDLPHVRTLYLHGPVPAKWLDYPLAQAMFVLGITHWDYTSYASISRAEDGSLRHVWAGLQCLSLHGIALRPSLQTTKSPEPTCSEMLRAFLWARRQGGARIPRLEIEDCTDVASHDLRHFQFFADVVYDGKGLKMAVEKELEHLCLRSYSIDVLALMIEGKQANPR
ncbi:hypothetical protein K438DRAFT_1941535 [Mycena galopus ATCC 62051]|nr:hypothetical protein K438DRAFT_1941535 [Mycena galopus ATCC 62051]